MNRQANHNLIRQDITKSGWHILKTLKHNGGVIKSRSELIRVANMDRSTHTRQIIKDLADAGLIELTPVLLDKRPSMSVRLIAEINDEQ